MGCALLHSRADAIILADPLTKALLAAMLAVAVVAAPAAANVPDPLTRVNPVRIPWTGDGTNGTLTTNVTYSDTTATATASTGDSISLGKGFLFHLRTCVAYHLATTVPVSSCEDRIVDTRQNTGSVATHAPAVTLAEQPRPRAGSWGYFTPYTEVQYESSAQVIAQSWPEAGLQGAAVAVAARGQTTGTLPANSPLTLDGPFTSAVNTGQPDSICAAGTTPGIYGSVRPGVRTSHPAFPDAPAYYEYGPPAGDYAGQDPRGVMLLIHGGGWWVGGVEGVGSMRDDAERWRARGWETVSFSYRACGQSLGDALWFYDKARSWFGTGARICSMGTSAGGQLSLLVGANRRGLSCIVSIAGPTDLSRIQDEPVYNHATGLYDSTSGSRLVHNLGAAAFGEENLATYSPAAQVSASLRRTRVLQAFSADDTLVPFRQAADLGAAMRAANPAAYVDNVQLAIGTIRSVTAP